MQEVTDYSPVVKQVLDACLGVKPKEKVWIQSWDHTLDLAKALASGCSQRACSHLLSVRYEDIWLRAIMDSPKRQLSAVAPQDEAILAETDFFIFMMGPKSPIPWDSIPKEKQGAISVWLDTRYDKTSYARKWARIAKTHGVKMLAIEATLATPERAKVKGLNHGELRRVMFKGCAVDHKEIARRGKTLAKLLSGKGRVSITARAGTRLSLALDQRPTEISDGMATEETTRKGRIVFLPAGAIEVSVDEESAEGRIVYDAPVRLGNERIENLVIDLTEGRVKKYRATKGADAFEGYLSRGGRDSGRFAFFGFGLNPNLRHGFTQDDKVLGSLTLGFGANETMGGKNIAADQWWASVRKATVEIDSITVMDGGKLLV